jgi:hypothetical protein
MKPLQLHATRVALYVLTQHVDFPLRYSLIQNLNAGTDCSTRSRASLSRASRGRQPIMGVRAMHVYQRRCRVVDMRSMRIYSTASSLIAAITANPRGAGFQIAIRAF